MKKVIITFREFARAHGELDKTPLRHFSEYGGSVDRFELSPYPM